MSVYKPKDRETYTYDFWFGGTRFRGSTEATSRREALVVQKRVKDQLKKDAEKAKVANRAFKGEAPLTIGLATAKWWTEVGQHHAGADTSWKNLERIVDYFGADRRLDDITDADVSAWIAARRGDRIKGKTKLKDDSPAPLVKEATVNRSTLQPLQRIYTRARLVWKLRFDNEPEWKRHKLPEPGEQHVELSAADQDRILPALGDGYREAVMFALASGLRLANCIIRWKQIDWDAGKLTVTQKGKRQHTIPLSREMRVILLACRGKDKEWVFNFPLRRRSKARRILGELYPVTYYGLQIEWRRTAAELGIDLNFHGLRHTAGTRLTRKKGNLKLAQRLLGHSSIKTTAGFYAHATDEDLRQALDETPLASPRPAVIVEEKAKEI